jgi:acyl-CoA hydrolase
VTQWHESAEGAVDAVRSGDRVYVQGASAFPQTLIDALTLRGEPDAPGGPLQNVELVHLHTNGRAPYLDARYQNAFHHRALFVGPNAREAIQCGRASYVPIFLSDVPDLFRSGNFPIDVALIHVSPPDSHGYCSLGTSVDVTLAAVQTARVVVAQVNPQMPRTLGESFIHLSDIDHAVEIDTDVPEMPAAVPTPTQQAIGEHVAELVPDGATVQIGIGGIPDSVLRALSHRKDLGIHSEVISDGILDLVERGVVTGARKTINKGKIVTSFLNGSRRLYEFAHDNPALEMRPNDYTNNSSVIVRIDTMIAINSALEIDLTGQVCAESIAGTVYSGVGGQMDFMRGAALSRGGKPIIALQSTARSGSISRIVPVLHPGAGVTTSRAHVHYVATEFGVANLHGLDLEERARALIGIAHPDFREELERAARTHWLIGPAC